MKLLITGALSGLGYQYAKTLAKKGHIIYAGVENEKQQNTLENKLKKEKVIMFPIICQLLDETTWPDFKQLDIDGIILQAGIGVGGSILEIDQQKLKENFTANVFQNIKLLQSFMQAYYQSETPKKIWITSSLAAFLPLPYLASYTMTKASLYLLARTLYLETKLQHLPFQVSVILPGAYATGFNEVMIENKYASKIYLKKKAKQMTKLQYFLFHLVESKNKECLAKQIEKSITSKKQPFIISRPLSQYMMTKIYNILLTIYNI
mgnify:CR=1 FL=1